MNTPHNPVQFLIQRAEQQAVRRSLRNVRPKWLTELTHALAELFEPLRGVGRVGFESELGEDRWEVSLFLGQTEQVGGSRDGEERFLNFRYDLKALLPYFERIDSLVWAALPGLVEELTGGPLCQLVLEGVYEGEPVCVRIQSLPPAEMGLGLRMHANGHAEAL